MNESNMISLYNAGIYLQMAGTSVLVDALEDGYTPYEAAGWELLSLGADALLFTHKHPDHFSPRMSYAYLQRHPACRVFAGNEVVRCLSELGISEERLILLKPYVPEKLNRDLALSAWPSRHMGPEYMHKEHFSLLLQGQSQRILFTGDAAPVHNSFEHGAECVGRVDIMVAPYVYALYEPAQRMFGKSVDTDVLVVNHIPVPDAEDIRAHLRAIPRYARGYRMIVSETNSEVEVDK